jgi:hypothetical protein
MLLNMNQFKQIAQASHGHPLFREDHSSACFKLEEATRATSHAASIKPFQRAKNGRDLCLANMLASTNGKPRSNATNSHCT